MSDNKKSLNDILNDYQILENELISSNGEINEDLENKLNLHEKELGDKLDGYEHFVRYLKGKIEYLKSMEIVCVFRKIQLPPHPRTTFHPAEISETCC